MKHLCSAIILVTTFTSLVVLAQPDNLELGIPGKVDQIINREGYALGYWEKFEQPRWVTYRLTREEVTNQVASRQDNFQPDPDIKTRSADLADYRGSGYDRGHHAPAADMKWSEQAMFESFYLSNMSPQVHECNSGIWNEIEMTVRGFACTEASIFIVTGPIITNKHPKVIGKINKVAVPDGFYKVIYDETPPQKMIGFMVANENAKGEPADYACSVAEVEKVTGLKFFSSLPLDKQSLKSKIDKDSWDWSKRQTARPRMLSICGNGPEEYFAGGQMPVASRTPAPVNDKWPETGYWLSTNSNKRHNKKCPNYRKTRGRPCSKEDGSKCGICGG